MSDYSSFSSIPLYKINHYKILLYNMYMYTYICINMTPM